MRGVGFSAALICSGGCPERYPLDEIVYRCRACGGLLHVEHALPALAAVSAAEWRARFEARWRSPRWPEGSGVWGKREWVLPEVAPENIVSFGEGGSPLQPADRYAMSLGLRSVWLKQCGASHTGSFKDLGMTVLVSQVRQAIANGRPIRAVACASTGDTSAALAAYAAAAGIPALVLLPKDKVSLAQLLQPLAHGATVLSLDTDFDGCMGLVEALTARGGIYLANSMNSLRVEGQKTVALEIVQQLEWSVPDWILIPGGNLGNVFALGQGLSMMRSLGLIDRLPRICVAQAARANPLYRAFVNGWDAYAPVRAEPTAASAIQIGNPVSVHRAIGVLKATGGVVEQASEDELADAVARADRSGLYACPHTGVALAALEKLARRGEIDPAHRVVVVSTAHGLKFSEFKRAYHEAKLPGATSRAANLPIELPAELGAVLAAVDRATGSAS